MSKRSLKGGAFERWLCKQLSSWWTKGLEGKARDDVFWRTSGSGARATSRRKSGRSTANSHGDVGCLDEVGRPLLSLMTFELKRGYNGCTLVDLLDSSVRYGYRDWVVKAERDAGRANSFSWVIIHKRDLREPLVVMPGCLYTALYDVPVACGGRVYYSQWLWVLPLECFLSLSPRELVRTAKMLEETK